MAGCTRRQMMWRVLIPSARPWLMVGVNQVIMLSLNMVIIASMIGAGGLGFDVLAALRRLDFGAGLEAGARDRAARDRARPAEPGLRRRPAAGATRVAQPASSRRHPASGRGARAAARRLGCSAALVPAIADLPEGLADHHRRCWSTSRWLDQRPLLRHHRGDQDLAPAQPAWCRSSASCWACPGSRWSPLLALAGWQLGGRRLAAADRLASRCSSRSPATGRTPWRRSISAASRC